MKQQYQYSFISTWKIVAPIQEVWNILYNNEDWPNWWKGVLKAKTSKEGDENNIGKIVNYSWRSILPYTLNFIMISEKIEKPFLMYGKSEGELQGEGTWTFKETNGVVTATCLWNVNTNKTWMNKMAFLLRPLFIWNHKVVMRWGAKGLAKKLNAKLLEA
ncbi:SRPBCC family protein [Ferruginibacter albus]|uniref:SRPBCC family protein n=1 Tax=Ferruginibacter albus TaxID=2875540 RepID=UPI001CC3D99C|nr:SRPBCC family protein [Ferruginibacter albus]UAY52109.1 SRPBCC family protein [Ferruginibacter albus]